MPNDQHAIAVIMLTVFALFLFTRDRIPLQTSSLAVLCLLILGFEFFPFYYQNAAGESALFKSTELFYGFGHEALIAVCGLMIMGGGLVKTGALEPVGELLTKAWKFNPGLSFLATLLLTAFLSAFINNTPIVVLLIPILVNVALRTGNSPSGMLMPMGFASLLGGMATTIGTSTNLLVISVAADMGQPAIGMFDFYWIASLCAFLGIAFLWLVAPTLLPKRDVLMNNTSSRIFTAHLVVQSDSTAIGQTLSELKKLTDYVMQVDKIRRSATSVVMALPDVVIQAGDKLLVHGTADQLRHFANVTDTVLYAGRHKVDADHPLVDEDDNQLIEVIVDQRSPLLGKTLQSAHFIESYQMLVLAIHRRGEKITEMPRGIGNLTLRLGDILLVQGKREHIDALKSEHEFLVLDGAVDVPTSHKAPMALGVMAFVILAAALGLLPIAVSAVLGVLVMLLCGCMNWHDITRSLSVPVVMIVVSSLALGKAMGVTGASGMIADQFVMLTEGAAPIVVLSALMLLMAVFTNVVSNNAAAVIGTPIAINIATTLGVDPKAFILAVLFGANMSYATPMAYKTNLLIMSAGNYSFTDFLRVGIPLTLIMWVSYSLLLALFYL